MTNWVLALGDFWGSISIAELVLWVSCLLLLLFARKIFLHIFHVPLDTPQGQNKLKIFRAAGLLIMVVLLLNHFIFNGLEGSLAKKLIGFMMIVFSGYWATQILQFLIRRRYGQRRESSGEMLYSESYNSRFLSLLVAAFIFVFALIGVVQLLGFESLLEAGGVIGVVGVMLALTQGAWAPDIISGLIILNSRFFEEGDVIQVGSGTLTARVYRTRLFHTELLNLVNNSRVLIKNSKLRETTIHNLSKFASVKGFRQSLSFKIAYDTPSEQVRAMFLSAYESAVADDQITLESAHELEVRVGETGDYAVEWLIYYYTKDMKSVLKTRQLFLEKVLNASEKAGISLATPQLYQGLTEAVNGAE